MATSSSHTLVLKPGESFTLPPGGELIFVSDPAGLTTDCGSVPTTTYKCGYFFLNLDSTAFDLTSMDESHTYLEQVRVGDVKYTIHELITPGQNPGTLVSVSTFNAHITDPALFSFMGIARTVLSARQYISIYFQCPEDLFEDAQIMIDNRGSRQFYPSISATCGEYPAHTDTDVDYDDN